VKCDEIINKLQSMASDKYKSNVIKMGIPEEDSLGVSTANIRKMAKMIKKSNELAYELWETGYHEAKLLAVLLFDTKDFSLIEVEQLMNEVFSWDLCDHICKNLIIKMDGYDKLISKWCESERLYTKRAAFTLIASTVVNKKDIDQDVLDDYLQLINQYSTDEKEHVKKAILWALREIGKRDFDYNEKAIILSYEMVEDNNKARNWIGRNALKELENLVKVEGRKRLISANSKMGQVVKT
jgi:3-methyladenine DNA glycosylase AlkD